MSLYIYVFNKAYTMYKLYVLINRLIIIIFCLFCLVNNLIQFKINMKLNEVSFNQITGLDTQHTVTGVVDVTTLCSSGDWLSGSSD